MTTTLYCPDCGKPMKEERYERPWGDFSTFTCHTDGCALKQAITMTPEQWATITPEQLSHYRRVNAVSVATSGGAK